MDNSQEKIVKILIERGKELLKQPRKKIEFTKNSKKQLRKLNSRIQQKILFVLNKFKNNHKIDIIKLKNRKNEFRIRTGNYRIQLEKIEEVFFITKIGKRENFYLVFF